MSRTIILKKATRIEGNADLHVEIEAGKVVSARFQVHDFRGLEKFLSQRRVEFVPQLVSRVCGLCSASHQVASLMAIEEALDVNVSSSVKALRDIILLGELISSHALSYFFLSFPDFVGAGGGIFEMMSKEPEVAADALAVRKIGLDIVELLGKRAVHPTTLGVGGFLEGPSPEVLGNIRAMAGELKVISAGLIEKVEGMTVHREKIPFPSGHKVNFITYNGAEDEGVFTVFDSLGSAVSRFSRHQFEENVSEMRAEWTFAKFPYLKNMGFPDGIVLTGPLSRIFGTNGLRADESLRKFAMAERLAEPSNLGLDLFDTCRILEIYRSASTIEELLNEVDLTAKQEEPDFTASGQGIGVIEAPRGILVHNYLVRQGCLERIRLMVATQFNNPLINLSIRELAEGHVEGEKLSAEGEKLIGRCIRTFDPCLSCATH